MAGKSGGKQGAFAFVAAFAVASFAGCALVLDASSDLHDHCSYAGEQGELCGICIASECRPQVDTCCGNEACSDELGALDDCSTGDEEACLLLATQTYTGQLGACVVSHCALDCLPETVGEGGSSVGGGIPGLVAVCAGSDVSCNCVVQLDEGQVSPPCSSSSFEHGTCCAEPGYPAEGLGCVCLEVECQGDELWCTCGYGDVVGASDSFCPGFDYEVCCLDPTVPNCECGSEPCEAQELLVDSCSASEVGCPTGTEDVFDCSL